MRVNINSFRTTGDFLFLDLDNGTSIEVEFRTTPSIKIDVEDSSSESKSLDVVHVDRNEIIVISFNGSCYTITGEVVYYKHYTKGTVRGDDIGSGYECHILIRRVL